MLAVFLSHFDSKTVNNVLDELHNSESVDISTQVFSKKYGNQAYDVLSVYPSKN